MKKVSYVFVLVTLLCIGLMTQIKPAHADSGWDSSYSGGGSSSWSGGSSSWDSGSSWSGGSSYSDDGDIGGFVFAMIFIVLIVVGAIMASKKANNTISSTTGFSMIPYDIEKIKAILPNFNKEEFRIQTYAIYKNIQEAWMNFDYEVLRKYTTDELYNLYHSQLVALNVKKQKNIMKDFELKAFEIVGMERIENTIALKVRMTVECLDYVVDKNNKVVRGTDKNKLVYNYEMTFIKGMDTKSNKCPNCNAPLENVNSSVCPYCDSVIISSNYDWVLSKKQMISQYRK